MNYTLLFREMCHAIGIKAEVIEGQIKTSVKAIGNPNGIAKHAWNTVQLNEQWQLLDLTMASGYVRKNCTGFVKDFRAVYLFMEPATAILSHLPDKEQWQLLEKPVEPSDFIHAPYTAYGIHKFGITDLQPIKGYLQKDTIHFSLNVRNKDILDQIVVYEDEQITYPIVDWDAEKMSFDYPLQSPKSKYLAIHFETTETSFLVLKYVLKKP